jgi:hypothetical protein
MTSRIPHFTDLKYWQRKNVLEIGCSLAPDTINVACHGAQVTSDDWTEKSLDPVRSAVALRQSPTSRPN